MKTKKAKAKTLATADRNLRIRQAQSREAIVAAKSLIEI